MTHSSLGATIKELRMAKNLTQTELGEGIVSASMISQIEADRVTPSATLLVRLAERLDVDVDDLRANLQEKVTHLGWYRDAKCLYQAGSYARALKPYSRLAETRSQHVDHLEILLEYAECLSHVKQVDQAVAQYQRAYEEAISAGEVERALVALSRLGRLETNRGSVPQAYIHLWKAKGILQTERSIEAGIKIPLLVQFARSCYLLRYLDDAEQALLSAYEIASQQQIWDQFPNILLSLGLVYKLQNQFDNALHYLTEAENHLQVQPDHSSLLQVKLHKAGVLSLSGGFEESYQLLQDCLQSFSNLSDQWNIANCYHELAIWSYRQGNLSESVKYGETSLSYLDENSLEAAHVYQTLAGTYRASGNHKRGISLLEQAVRIYMAHGYLQHAAEFVIVLLEWYREHQQFEQACAIGLEFAEVIKQSRAFIPAQR